MAPRSIPEGLVVELSRAKVLPGASAEADHWMRMLDDRVEECVATLDRERMAVEIVFRLQEDGRDYLYWVATLAESVEPLETAEHQIDTVHDALVRRTKKPGWVEAEPQVLMLPAPVRDAV